MNFTAIIGIVDKKVNIELKGETCLMIKVEKPHVEKDEVNGFDVINAYVNNKEFRKDLKSVKRGSIVGIKGRLLQREDGLKLITERFQAF